ncbi:G-D-S-L family lipolytic protein [Croceitalea dokdonensis DOKDO 023]|uniref:G-D-S-L family lipolytic protein n=1 Tax=Croceitalea dokdonensis DOKDO 023 TaxID=1300341 RepID=A0A0P7AYP3_9FLAO|nr:SGNH/GDSL hydrolase family protein [Croceitalea dokdonensis]KPM33278.1 G-D-S-L family lipolytic protein [Croceitalea dokdonensis DOKDO 023]
METKKTTPLIILLVLFSFSKPLKAQDWANLTKYQKANKAVEFDESQKNRVVFMGNSITEGWPKEFFEGKTYLNRGISGQTTPQMLLRFRQDVINLQPKAVVILAGTNDIAGNTGPMTLEQIRDNIESMVELAKSNKIVPIVCSVLPAYDYPWRPGLQPNIKIPKLNALLLAMAQEQEVPYLDYFSAMADERNGLPKKWTTDEVHITPKGYEVMGDLVEKAIAQALKE